jgi:hypothetical protein
MMLLTFDTTLENFRDDLRVVARILETGAEMSYVSPDFKYNIKDSATVSAGPREVR